MSSNRNPGSLRGRSTGSGLTVLYDSGHIQGTQASLDSGTISPSQDKILEVHLWGRTTTAALAENLLMAFNGDTTAGNYDQIQHLAGTSGHGVNTISDSRFGGQVTGASSASGLFGYQVLRIPFAGSSSYLKFFYHEIMVFNAGTTSDWNSFFGRWDNTAAINNIVFTPTGNFAIGSRLRIIEI